MQTSTKLFVLVAAIALPFSAACTSATPRAASTSAADTLADGGLCCASVAAATVPACKIDDDCCSGVCGPKNVCTCAAIDGFCAIDSDCCGSAVHCDTSVPSGACTSGAPAPSKDGG